MLRVTQRVTPGEGTIVALEGKLLRPWVDEIRALFCQRAPSPLPGLDLSALTFADKSGVELLEDLIRQGARVESCSAFVAALLQLNDSPEVPRPHEEGAP